MIDLKIDNDNVKRLVIMGTASTIIADTIAAISLIYVSLSKNDKNCGRRFKELVEAAVKDGLPWKVGEMIEVVDSEKDEGDIESMLSTLEKILNKKGKKE